MTLSQRSEDILRGAIEDVFTNQNYHKVQKQPIHSVQSTTQSSLPNTSGGILRSSATLHYYNTGPSSMQNRHLSSNSSAPLASFHNNLNMCRAPYSDNAPLGFMQPLSGPPATPLLSSMPPNTPNQRQFYHGHGNGGPGLGAQMSMSSHCNQLYPAIDAILNRAAYQNAAQIPPMPPPPAYPSHMSTLHRNPSAMPYSQMQYQYQQRRKHVSRQDHLPAQLTQSCPPNWNTHTMMQSSVSQPFQVHQSSTTDNAQRIPNRPINVNASQTSSLNCGEQGTHCFIIRPPSSQEQTVAHHRQGQPKFGMKLPTKIGSSTRFNHNQKSCDTGSSQSALNRQKSHHTLSTELISSTGVVLSQHEHSSSTTSLTGTSNCITQTPLMSELLSSAPTVLSTVTSSELDKENPSSQGNDATLASTRLIFSRNENGKERTHQPINVIPSIPQESLNRFLFSLYHEDDPLPQNEEDENEKSVNEHSNKRVAKEIKKEKCDHEMSEHHPLNETSDLLTPIENSSNVTEDSKDEEIKPYLTSGFHSCGSCELPFNYEFSLLAHVHDQHEEDAHITCAHCFETVEKTSLLVHLNLMHNGSLDRNVIACGGSFQDWRCSFTNTSKKEMENHMVLNHAQDCQLYRCYKCNFSCSSIHDYISHWSGESNTCNVRDSPVPRERNALEEMNINALCASNVERQQEFHFPEVRGRLDKSPGRERSSIHAQDEGESHKVKKKLKKSCEIRTVSPDDPAIEDIVSLVDDVLDKQKWKASQKMPDPPTVGPHRKVKKRKDGQRKPPPPKTGIECFICHVHTKSRDDMMDHYRAKHRDAVEMQWIDHSINPKRVPSKRRRIGTEKSEKSRKKKNKWDNRKETKREKVDQERTRHSPLCDEMREPFHNMVQRNDDVFDTECEHEETSAPLNVTGCETDEEPLASKEKPQDKPQQIVVGPNVPVPLKTGCVIYCCNKCPYKGRSRFHFALHLGQHSKFKKRLHPIPPKLTKHKCDRCGYFAIDFEDHDQHQALHEEQKRFVCLCCSQDFTAKDRMRRHLIDSHQIPRDLDHFFLDRMLLFKRMLKDTPKIAPLDFRICLKKIL